MRENDTLTPIIVSLPTHGTAVLNADKTITYTHDGTKNYEDSFTYKVNDGQLDSNVATVSVNVNDMPPVARNDSATVEFKKSVIINVLNNDTDLENDTLTPIIVSPPTHGTAVLNADKTITYTHDGTKNYEDSFTYKLNDGRLDSNTANVNIGVGKEVVVFDADYLVLTYNFSDGRDLDTRSRIVIPDIGEDTVGKSLGWSASGKFPSSEPILSWGGDNTGTGLESILLDIKKFAQKHPNSNKVVIDCRAFWYGEVGYNKVNMKAIFYKGGSMGRGNYTWKNETANGKKEYSTQGKVVPADTKSNARSSKGFRICTFTYIVNESKGIFDLHDTVTPEL